MGHDEEVDVPAQRHVTLPLTAAQRRVRLAGATGGDFSTGKVARCVEMRGPTDRVHFETALREVVARTEALHVRVVDGVDGPVQFVGPRTPVAPSSVDLGEEDDPVRAADDWLADAATLPLPPGRTFHHVVLQVVPGLSYWYAEYHPIALDAFGAALVERHVVDAYRTLGRHDCRQPTGTGALRELVALDVAYRASAQRDRDRAYWRSLLDGPPARPARNVGTPGRHRITLPPHVAIGSHRLAHRLGVPLRRLLVAVSAVAARAVTGERDVLLGLPVTCRAEAASRLLAGPMGNVVPLRLRVDRGVEETCAAVTAALADGLPHQRYCGEDAVREAGLPGPVGTAVAPVVDVVRDGPGHRLGGRRWRSRPLRGGLTGDVHLTFTDRAGPRLDLDVTAADTGDADAYLDRLRQVLDDVTTGGRAATRQAG
ncbi:condensation domain-containing protein [Actinosynnema sp. NPDC023794]